MLSRRLTVSFFFFRRRHNLVFKRSIHIFIYLLLFIFFYKINLFFLSRIITTEPFTVFISFRQYLTILFFVQSELVGLDDFVGTSSPNVLNTYENDVFVFVEGSNEKYNFNHVGSIAIAFFVNFIKQFLIFYHGFKNILSSLLEGNQIDTTIQVQIVFFLRYTNI